MSGCSKRVKAFLRCQESIKIREINKKSALAICFGTSLRPLLMVLITLLVRLNFNFLEVYCS